MGVAGPARVRGRVVTGLVALVVLGGCAATDPGETAATHGATSSRVPSLSPPPSPVPSPSSTPSAFDASVEPVAPPELDGPPSQEAASEVAKYFFSLYPYIQATGDVSRWDALTGDPCRYCESGRAIAHDISAAGNRSVGGQIEFIGVDTDDYAPDEYAVLLWMVDHPSQVVDGHGNVVEDFPETITASADMHVSWRDGGWRIDTVAIDVYTKERL